MNIFHKIEIEKQGVQECVQASAVQILNYYGISKSIDQVKDEVPVYIDPKGIKLGTSLGHIATYFQNLGLKSIVHTSDIMLFDPTWAGLPSDKIIEKIRNRAPNIKHGWYDSNAISTISNGYITYLEAGGRLEIAIVDVKYLLKFLELGPLYMVVSYNVLNKCTKYDFTQNPQAPNDITGLPSTHAIVVSGYRDGIFEIVDPDFEYGGYRKMPESQLIAAYYEAQTDMDNLFISLSK